MLTPEETARRRRINRILLPIVGLVAVVIFVAVILVNVSEKRAEDRRVDDAMESASAPKMTDDEFEQFSNDLADIDPALVDHGTRAHARDTCSSIDGRNAVPATMTRFSNLDHDVTEAEAKTIIASIRDIGFCERK